MLTRSCSLEEMVQRSDDSTDQDQKSFRRVCGVCKPLELLIQPQGELVSLKNDSHRTAPLPWRAAGAQNSENLRL